MPFIVYVLQKGRQREALKAKCFWHKEKNVKKGFPHNNTVVLISLQARMHEEA